MSVEFLNVILLVEDRGHVGPRLGVLLVAPDTAGVVTEVPLASEVEGEVNDSLLTVQILLLKETIRHNATLVIIEHNWHNGLNDSSITTYTKNCDSVLNSDPKPFMCSTILHSISNSVTS